MQTERTSVFLPELATCLDPMCRLSSVAIRLRVAVQHELGADYAQKLFKRRRVVARSAVVRRSYDFKMSSRQNRNP